MTADKCLESFALEVLDDFATTGINADGIGILVDVGEGYAGEMGFTFPDQGVPWGLERVDSYEWVKELWLSMDKTWDSAFLVANLQTGKNEYSFYTNYQMHPWRNGRND